ncbi:hypothetical protein [Leptotrichia wadei]|nr:hypothetical protein [Leptotrichia wadei]
MSFSEGLKYEEGARKNNKRMGRRKLLWLSTQGIAKWNTMKAVLKN